MIVLLLAVSSCRLSVVLVIGTTAFVVALSVQSTVRCLSLGLLEPGSQAPRHRHGYDSHHPCFHLYGMLCDYSTLSCTCFRSAL